MWDFTINDKELTNFYDNAESKVFSNEKTDNEIIDGIQKIINQIDQQVLNLEKFKLQLGSLLDYENLKEQGCTLCQLEKVRNDDEAYLNKVDGYYKDNLKKRNYMFGYPSNMEEDSFVCKYLRYLESKLYFMNNCGDPYERGNYGMDSKEIEREIIAMFAKSLGLNDGYWGYITTGGTESNFWAIREGFNKYPKGKLYFSQKTHYSVEKFVSNNNAHVYPYEVIQTNKDGSIDVLALEKAIKKDLKNKVCDSVILVLTFGTTKEGAIDDAKEITSFLIENDIPYYCHLDSALYGGISRNQLSAPTLGNVKDYNVDSVSISLHKFLGMARANGILIALHRDKRKVIDYIGQEDSTMLGSRDYLPFSTYQRCKEFLERKPANHYITNVIYFKKLLVDNKIPFTTFDNEKCNIFVINKPSDWICKKYQLTTFNDGNDFKAHIIIFPFHSKWAMDELLKDLVNDK